MDFHGVVAGVVAELAGVVIDFEDEQAGGGGEVSTATDVEDGQGLGVSRFGGIFGNDGGEEATPGETVHVVEGESLGFSDEGILVIGDLGTSVGLEGDLLSGLEPPA